MPTTYSFDSPQRWRVLPLKEVRITYTNGDIVKIFNPHDGAQISIEPITRQDDYGIDYAIAHKMTVSLDIMQNSLGYDKQYLANLSNSGKVINYIYIYFSNDTSLYGATYADEYTVIYAGGSSYNDTLGANTLLSFKYDEKQPMAHLELTAILRADYFDGTGTWATDTNWATYSW